MKPSHSQLYRIPLVPVPRESREDYDPSQAYTVGPLSLE